MNWGHISQLQLDNCPTRPVHLLAVRRFEDLDRWAGEGYAVVFVGGPEVRCTVEVWEDAVGQPAQLFAD